MKLYINDYYKYIIFDLDDLNCDICDETFNTLLIYRR